MLFAAELICLPEAYRMKRTARSVACPGGTLVLAGGYPSSGWGHSRPGVCPWSGLGYPPARTGIPSGQDWGTSPEGTRELGTPLWKRPGTRVWRRDWEPDWANPPPPGGEQTENITAVIILQSQT